MSRRTKAATVQMTVLLGGNLSPLTAYDLELMTKFGYGRVVEVTIWQERSPRHHRLYWVILNYCVTNSEGKYGSSEDLHSAVKVGLGYTRRIKLLIASPHAQFATAIKTRLTRAKQWLAKLLINHLLKIVAGHDLVDGIVQELDDSMKIASQFETECEHITLPGSIAFDQMDQSEFRVFFDRAMEQLRCAGYPVDAYLKESNQDLSAARLIMPRSAPPYHTPEPNVSQSNLHPESALPPPDHY